MISLFLAIYAVDRAEHIAVQASFEQFKQLEPARVSVSDFIEEIPNTAQKRIFLNITNIAQYQETGQVYLYRVEANPFLPHVLFPSLKPGESHNYSIVINYTTLDYAVSYGSCTLPPFYESFFVLEKNSVSYRVTCENCREEGRFRRFPNLQEVEARFQFNPRDNSCNSSISIYSWPEVPLSAIKNTK